eukprot:TRINITY_DN6548_c0_g1_i1.p1 TRINITY_DN6548_c0_g1~~TRINITY_DN6548_c0_g1_i1.p1  ORF type:complete len:146 (+),score=34.42 TRINITY_DN6548_c0_g1_i1:23-439(+)
MSAISIVTFQEAMGEETLGFYIMQMVDSYFVWFGRGPPTLTRLDAAFPTRFEDVPTATNLIGLSTDGIARGVSQRLAKRFKVAMFVSTNITGQAAELVEFAERKLIVAIKKLQSGETGAAGVAEAPREAATTPATGAV